MARSKRTSPYSTYLLSGERKQFRVCPGTRSSRIRVANCFDHRWIDRRTGLSPFAANVGQHAGDLIVGQDRSNRRHQSNRAFFAVQQDSRRDVGCCQRKRRTDQAWRDLLLSTSVRLVACLTDVSVDFPSRVEPLLLFRRERWDGSGGSRLAGPLDSGEDISGTSRQVVGALAHRRQRRRLGIQTKDSLAAATPSGLGRRPLESVCSAWPRATARAGRAWQDSSIRRRATVWRSTRHRAAQHGDFCSTKDRRPLPLRLGLVSQPGEKFLNRRVLSGADDRACEHRHCGLTRWRLSAGCEQLLENSRLTAPDAAQAGIHNDRIISVTIEQGGDCILTRPGGKRPERSRELLTHRPIWIVETFQDLGVKRMIRRRQPALGETDRRDANVLRWIRECLGHQRRLETIDAIECPQGVQPRADIRR